MSSPTIALFETVRLDLVLPQAMEVPAMISGYSLLSVLIASSVVLLAFVHQPFVIVVLRIVKFFREQTARDSQSCNDLVERIKKDRQELEILRSTNTKLRKDVERAEAKISAQGSRIIQQDEQHAKRGSLVQRLEQQCSQGNKWLKAERSKAMGMQQQFNTIQQQITAASMREANTNQAYTATCKQLSATAGALQVTQTRLEETRKFIIDLQLENELLKSPMSPAPPVTKASESTFSALASPFVLVLVDGDAYIWAGNHFTQNLRPAGAHAAQAIRLEVQQYLLASTDRAPLQSKIVTRVFHNAHGLRHQEARTQHARHRLSDFAVDFTESMPLFDYTDCGRGKERADSKIQETFHLFIANPHCHTIFLAAAVDNGFARLLEQYASVDAAKQKVVLVHPGYLIHETAELNYQAVEWPSVFQHRLMPMDAQTKFAHQQQLRNKDMQVQKAAASRAITQGVFGISSVDMIESSNIYTGARKLGWRPSRVIEGVRDEGLVEEID
ncbi:hypothetical protein LTR05_004349 [Lithohypha guttulata]|uniref:DUF7923 domain-containing protein n=1 Tax=Lithohypha guttulata TaxID=1690604 RepID=A0AAN7Y7D0_9EURO|nr:hypothetical protein LTR05_004349 [Lithohypha guttulata]